ncbi:hypothetical protein [Peribacillus asahii]|uniref:hypothetical protein n=1 Tax=Peribacillus asahii TaxID=228899 RepID=UPI00381279BE
MSIKGMGSYTSLEYHLETLSIDEKNELYLSGRLDLMLDEAERKNRSNIKYRYKQHRKGEKSFEAV